MISNGGPLQGVRVLEIAKVWAGPYAGKLLAFLGAEVIKVESKSNLDEMRAYGGVDPDNAPHFLSINQEILSVQVNLKSERGLSYLRDMIGKSDIVLNNIRPGAMERMGLGYDGLRAIKPDIIAVSLKMYGNDGPLGYQTGYAPCFAALGGANYLVGEEGEAPKGVNIRYGDSSVGAALAFACVVALLHRDATGEGQFVDLSAVETMASLIGDRLLEYGLTGNIPAADGNAHPDMAPHGCYPCLEDRWISVAVSSDDEWRRLCKVLEDAPLAEDPRFRTAADRQRHRTELDERLSELTRSHGAQQLSAHLRSERVAAFNSQTSLDLIGDDHLWSRGSIRLVSDRQKGTRAVVGPSWHMSRTDGTISRGGPMLGEHNAYVYRDVLGLSEHEYQELLRDRVID